MNIIDQLARICMEIRLIEEQYKMPPHINFDKELTARAICDREARENALAKTLYYSLKNYALSNKDNFRC